MSVIKQKGGLIMAKGLHKNSLRKVDNPHQWMIDDARMELIQQIKAEVERRKKKYQKDESGYGDGAFCEDVAILSILSDLEKKEKPINPRHRKDNALFDSCLAKVNPKARKEVRKNIDKMIEQPVMIEWTGNNLKEVIEFTGKSPRFDEWFKTWDEYESYVHSHGNIFKLFNEDGTHLEVPVGAWIFKTPDGRNVPSTFLYQEQPVEVQKYRAYLISEIEKQYKQAEQNYQEAYEQKNETRMFDEAERDAWKRVLDWLKEEHGYDSSNEDLIPEQGQPVDLEKEIERWNVDNVDDNGFYDTVAFARHFYELGRQSKPNDQWSEEDENNLNKLLQWDGIPLGLRDWVSVLPEKVGTRPYWKPSEEQIAALKWQVEHPELVKWRKGDLESLLEQLKKL